MVVKQLKFNAEAGEALRDFNIDYGKQYQFGTPWNADNKNDTLHLINDYFFPKITETIASTQELGNRFDFLAKEVPYIGEFSEEYIILDSVPVALNLSKNADLMLKRNYPKMATILYNSGQDKKLKFTINDNNVRRNFSTIGDAIIHYRDIFLKQFSNINVDLEQNAKTMLVDYALNQAKSQYSATDVEDLLGQIGERILNIQNNSSKYNEAQKAAGGSLGRYTTQTSLNKLMILTTDKIKARLLDTRLANTFHAAGIDLLDHIISFDDLGGSWRVKKDVVISDPTTLQFLQAMGDYQVEMGDTVPEGAVLTFDVSSYPEFKSSVEEIKPKSELFAAIYDVDAFKFRRNTQNLLSEPFKNGENNETTYWLHYYSFMAISPFFNKIVIQGVK